jgi:hypothetical protein
MMLRACRRKASHSSNAHGKRYHYDNHDQLRQHLADFIAAYNFG